MNKKEKEEKKEREKKEKEKEKKKEKDKKKKKDKEHKKGFSYGSINLGAISLSVTPNPTGRQSSLCPPEEDADTLSSPKSDGNHTSPWFITRQPSANANISMYFVEEDRQREMEEIEKEVLKMELKKKMSPNMYQSVIKFESDVTQLRKQVEAVRKREKLAILRAEKEKREEEERQMRERELQEVMKGGEDEGVKGKIHMFKKIVEGEVGGEGVRLTDEALKPLDEKEEEEVEEKVQEEVQEEPQEEKEEEKLGKMRANVINEFIDTERFYIEDIHTLMKVFVYPMQVNSMITPAESKIIFSNIEDVMPIHESFLENLEKEISEHTANGGLIHEVELGALLSRFFHYFKLYSIYASNQDACMELVEQIKKKKDIANFFETCLSNPKCKNQYLNSYLIKPIQRLCKYPLLLRELMKSTPEEHPDFKALQDSLEKVNDAVNFVNEAKRKEERAKRMRAIADKFGIKDLVRPGRELIKEGKLGAWKKGGAKDDRYLFVFNNLVLVMKPDKGGDDKAINEHLLFKKIASADLSKTRIVNHPDQPEDGMISVFEIIFDNKALMFCCASEEDKRGWIKSVDASIQESQRHLNARMKREKEMEEKDTLAPPSNGGLGGSDNEGVSPRKKKGRTPLKRAISFGDKSSITARRKTQS